MTFNPRFKIHFSAAFFGALAVSGLISSSLRAQEPQLRILIDTRDAWKYFKGEAEPSPGTLDWTKPEFDEAKWLLGNTPMGYGEAALQFGTALTDMQTKYLTVYLRKSFTLDDPALVTRLMLNVQYDDGFAAYLNGVEIGRPGMPAEALRNTTPALDHEYTVSTFNQNIPPAGLKALKAGMNLLAVEMHNSSLNSSDLVFIPRLNGTFLPSQTKDCNQNGKDDAQDIAGGASRDLNKNGVPDECEGAHKQLPGDCNQSGSLNITDPICLLRKLFAGQAGSLFPCGDGQATHPANAALSTPAATARWTSPTPSTSSSTSSEAARPTLSAPPASTSPTARTSPAAGSEGGWRENNLSSSGWLAARDRGRRSR